MNTTIAITQPTRSFPERFYNIQTLNLQSNVSYNVRNISSSGSLMIVVNANQFIQQTLRFESNSKQYVMMPLEFSYKIIIIGNGELAFS